MIINIPSARSLNDVALRLYFYAWNLMMSIGSDFDEAYNVSTGIKERKEKWGNEWNDYLARCQPELELACTVIQQSNELALKARICAVSPYLLLLKSDAKFSNTEKEIDFTELRTLDAVDLPGVVNTFCPKKLTPKFIQTYNEIRALRNKIAHLGRPSKPFSVEHLFQTLVFQYIELWLGKPWLTNYLNFQGEERLSFFTESETGIQALVYDAWPSIRRAFSNKQFKEVFGCEKSQLKYTCFACFYNARGDYFESDAVECRTAYLIEAGSKLRCLMCNRTRKVVKRSCSESRCTSTLSSPMGGGHYFCPECGNEEVVSKTGRGRTIAQF